MTSGDSDSMPPAVTEPLTTRAARAGRRQPRASKGWERWVGEPRNAVWLVLGAVLVIGGGRRLLRFWRARDAVARLDGTSPTPADIEAAGEHGRAGLMQLFRLLASGDTALEREASGRALSVLWARDELIAEEEKALVLRGFAITVRSRRRYPRELREDIPFTLSYGLPFLSPDGPGIGPQNLEWSHRVVGARRVSLETFTPWKAGPVLETFSIVPSDFETPGPHALVIEVKVRPAGLTEEWELALPHFRLTFEFDPILRADSLLALPDEGRGAALARRVRLAAPSAAAGDSPRYVPLTPTLALRDPPELAIDSPLPHDLAHRIAVEFEGVSGCFRAGSLVVSGLDHAGESGTALRRPLGPMASVFPEAFERPGRKRMRAVLTADPHLGWAHPDVRSLWPGTIETDWFDVDIERR